MRHELTLLFVALLLVALVTGCSSHRETPARSAGATGHLPAEGGVLRDAWRSDPAATGGRSVAAGHGGLGTGRLGTTGQRDVDARSALSAEAPPPIAPPPPFAVVKSRSSESNASLRKIMTSPNATKPSTTRRKKPPVVSGR